MPGLSHRGRAILAAIIEEFIATGEPVSSRSAAKKARLDLSPATVRNVMAELEEQGLLAQPHTSAGRVPTEEGLRYFVGSLLKPYEPTPTDLERLRRQCEGAVGDPEELMRRAVRTLSLLGQAAGLVTTPRIEALPLVSLRFIPVRERTLLAVLVTAGGLVHQRAIQVPRQIERSELDRIHNYLNDLLVGRSLSELRELIAREAADARASMDRLRQRALDLGSQAIEDAASPELFVEGHENLLGHAEFSDSDRLRAAIRALAEKDQLLELLDRTLAAEGIHVLIGSESGIESLSGLTVITARYGDETSPTGTLGLIGPSRMDYAKAMSLVDHTAKLVSLLLQKRSS